MPQADVMPPDDSTPTEAATAAGVDPAVQPLLDQLSNDDAQLTLYGNDIVEVFAMEAEAAALTVAPVISG